MRIVSSPSKLRSSVSLTQRSCDYSLSTILSLAPAHTGMSQTPQMSQVSLANLLSTPRAAFMSAPHATSNASASSSRSSFPPLHRPSPFASSLAARFEDEAEEEEEDDDDLATTLRTPQDDDVLSSSSDESGDDDQTELSPYAPPTNSMARAIPIPPRPSSRSTPHPSSSVSAAPQYGSSRDDAFFSPLQPSRPLGAPSSDSPPLYSRRRGARRARGTTRERGGFGASSRGGNSSMSPQPGPASVEERRRARLLAAQSGWTLGERAGVTDVEDESVEPGAALSSSRPF